MDLFDWMAREHERLAHDLARCIDTPHSARLTAADCKALRQLGRYLAAREQVLFPALLALSPDDAARLAGRHEALRACSTIAWRRCLLNEPRATAALRAVRLALAELGALEPPLLRAIFSDNELREMAGEMRLAMTALDRQQRLRHAVAMLGLRLRRLLGLRPRRSLPTLRSAVFAYRG